MVERPAFKEYSSTTNAPLSVESSTPQNESGILIDPPVSEPVMVTTEDDAMAAADPPLDLISDYFLFDVS